MTAATAEFIKLYDSQGREIPASRRDLLKIEAEKFNPQLYRRLTNESPETYWLISDRPGKTPMLLKISVSRSRLGSGPDVRVSFGTNGIASYPHFNIEDAIRLYTRDGLRSDERLPENLAEIAREHVRYRTGTRTPGDTTKRLTVRTLPAPAMRRRLAFFTDADVSPLVELAAGKRLSAFELQLMTVQFADDNRLKDVYAFILSFIAVPLRSWPKLMHLTRKTQQQLAAG